jgi:hypothetical protein
MDPYTPTGGIQKAHQIELYTDTLFIRGTIIGPFDRTSDLINRWDRLYLPVQEVALAPLGQTANPKQISQSIFVPRPRIHFMAASPTAEDTSDQAAQDALTASSMRSRLAATAATMEERLSPRRDFQVPMVSKTCNVFTSVFVISGLCHMREGNTIESILDAQADFFPLTKAVIYPQLYPDLLWRRDLVLVNKALLQTIYTVDPPAHPPRPTQPLESP